MSSTPPPSPISAELLDRYLAGLCSVEDAARVEGWARVHHAEDVLTALKNDGTSPSATRLAADWTSIERRTIGAHRAQDQKLHQHTTSNLKRQLTQGRRHGIGHSLPRPLPRLLAYTAAAMFGGVMIILGQYVLNRPLGKTATTPVSYATGNGQRAMITLSDGTTVMLNVASRLDVPADYARGNRTLHLSGAAFFTTAHHTDTPLTVVAGTTTARVLGTSFIVRRYTTDTVTTVAVQDGKVAVGAVVLAAAQEVVVNGRHPARIQPADATQFGFATGLLVLRQTPLREAIPELNRWYDVDIRLGDPFLATQGVSKEVTMELAAGSRAELAKILELSLNVRVVRDGRVVTLFPR